MSIDSMLTPRLRAIAGCVPQGARVADVGTDHAYIPVYLCEKKKIESALAMDIKSGPLLRAEKNITRFGLQEQIKTRLSDGLKELKPGEADTAVIAGMGGLLITQILDAAPFALDCYVLQPMTAVAELRAYLEQNGYEITHEMLAKEGRKIYTVLVACHGSMKIEKPVHYLVGPKLLENRDPLTGELIAMLLKKYRSTLSGLTQAERLDVSEKQRKTADIVQDLESLKEVCDRW